MRAAWSELGAIDPKALVEARLQAHHAVQWVTRAARANLPAMPDDSHSNLGWEPRLRGLVSHDLIASDGSMYRCGLRIDAITLFVAKDWEMTSELRLDGRVDGDAASWIDNILTDLGLDRAGGVALPYDIPAHPVAAGGRYSGAADRPAFAELARWFEAADDILDEVKSRLTDIGSASGAVRCWPHHFDIATLLSLGRGDPERAAAIGIGMSPGDAYYPQPYFYISPWPAPPVDGLPRLPVPGHWHTLGFVAAVATGEELLSMPEPRAGMRRFIDAAIAIARGLLAA
jgi:hypothetical protein